MSKFSGTLCSTTNCLKYAFHTGKRARILRDRIGHGAGSLAGRQGERDRYLISMRIRGPIVENGQGDEAYQSHETEP